MQQQKIAVFGLGYVGLANAVLLAQRHQVVGIDIDAAKVALLNAHQAPFADTLLSKYLQKTDLHFRAETGAPEFVQQADWVMIATPTNYDPKRGQFNTQAIIDVIEQVIAVNSRATVVIKSTIAVGFSDYLTKKYPTVKFLFSPEFLREGRALQDNLEPTRIIVGTELKNPDLVQQAEKFANLLQECATQKSVPILIMGYTEAESVKLFANSYLAMRVAFFNELDNFALTQNLDVANVLAGVCADPRIGNQYNNPSFGFGGYCLSKDVQQLDANFRAQKIPHCLIKAIGDSNHQRQKLLVKNLCQQTPADAVIGVYRLVIKAGSDNCRSSATMALVRRLAKKRRVLLYEPTITSLNLANVTMVNDLTQFKSQAALILANRWDAQLADVRDKVYSRDVFNRD